VVEVTPQAAPPPPALDPVVREFLVRAGELAAGIPTDEPLPARRARERADSDALFRRFGEPGPAVDSVQELEVDVVGGTIRVRLYRPFVAERLPLHVVFHGGGWLSGSVDDLVVDASCRERAVAASCAVASVDYRLAPTHPFPTPLEDSYAALVWLVAHADRLGLDADGPSLGGASAGANLAAGVALLCRDRSGPGLAFQLLEVPALDLDVQSLSAAAFVGAVDLSEDMLRDAALMYAAGTPLDDPLLSPLRADLTGLPPAHVMTAGRDPLREQGEAYALRLRQAGVAATHSLHPAALHGSGFLTGSWPVARQWRDEVLAMLSRVHGGAAQGRVSREGAA
jgi:acetyl esterase